MCTVGGTLTVILVCLTRVIVGVQYITVCDLNSVVGFYFFIFLTSNIQ